MIAKASVISHEACEARDCVKQKKKQEPFGELAPASGKKTM